MTQSSVPHTYTDQEECTASKTCSEREQSEELNKQTLQGGKKGSFSAAAAGGGGEGGGRGAVSWLVVSYSYHQFNFGPQAEVLL